MKTWIKAVLAAPLFALLLAALPARADDAGGSPRAVVEQVVGDVMSAVKADPAMQAGDRAKIRSLVENKILPHTDFERTTRLAMGPQWAKATPEQRQRLQKEFSSLLINTYSGAIAQIKNQTVSYRPDAPPAGDDAVVRSQVNNNGQPIELDYRMGKTAKGWRIYDLNVMGAWLIEAYRPQFRDVISQRGIDGLIDFLAEKNKGIPNETPSAS